MGDSAEEGEAPHASEPAEQTEPSSLGDLPPSTTRLTPATDAVGWEVEGAAAGPPAEGKPEEPDRQGGDAGAGAPSPVHVQAGPSSRPQTAQSTRSGASTEPGQMSVPAKVLDGHHLRVRCIAWSNEWMATCADDSTAKIWAGRRHNSQHSWECAATLSHSTPVWSCVFAPDGRSLMTGTKNSCITAWKVLPQSDFDSVEKAFKQALDRKTKLEQSIEEVKKKIKKTGHDLETARVFAAERLRAEQGKLRTQLNYMKKLFDVDVGPKFAELQHRLEQLERACTDPWTVLWKQEMAGHFGPIESMHIAPNGRWLGTSSSDGSAAVWDLKRVPTGRSYMADGDPHPHTFEDVSMVQALIPQQKLLAHQDSVRSVAFNCKSNTMCTASDDGTARVWRLTEAHGTRQWLEVATLEEQTAEVTCCCFAPAHGKLVATIGRDGVVCVYHTDLVDEDEDMDPHKPQKSRRKRRTTKGSVRADSIMSASFDTDSGEEMSYDPFPGSPERFPQGHGLMSKIGSADSPIQFYDSLTHKGNVRILEDRMFDNGSTEEEEEEHLVEGGLGRERARVQAMLRYEEDVMRSDKEGDHVLWDDLPEKEREVLVQQEVDRYLASDELRSFLVWNKLIRGVEGDEGRLQTSSSSNPAHAGMPLLPPASRRAKTSYGRQRPRTGPSTPVSLPSLRKSKRAVPKALALANAETAGSQSQFIDTVHDLPIEDAAEQNTTLCSSMRTSQAASQVAQDEEKVPWAVAAKFQAYSRGVCSCMFSKDDKVFITSSSDLDVRLWDAKEWCLRFVVRGTASPSAVSKPAQGVFCMSNSLDGQWLITSSWDGAVCVWDMSPFSAVVSHQVDDDHKKRSTKYASPGYAMPIVDWAKIRAERAALEKKIVTNKRNNRNRLSFEQVTAAFHEHALPFSLQYHSVSNREGDVYASPVSSEEIGADWSDLFQRIQVFPLKYKMPQVSPRFKKFFADYEQQEKQTAAEDQYLDLNSREQGAPRGYVISKKQQSPAQKSPPKLSALLLRKKTIS